MKQTNTKGNAKRIAFLLLPYCCVILAMVLLTVAAFVYVTSSSLVQLAVNNMAAEPPAATFETSVIDVGDAEDFPVIRYKSQWATVNVDGWQQRNIPVFLGDQNDVLRNGAGTPLHSQFCGFGGRVVMDAHVTTYFNEIEETKVGTKVYVSTVYGKYIYRVDKIQLFDGDDSTYIYPSTDGEELVMYTCYPYDNGWHPRTQRIALICSKVEGKDWRSAQ